MQIGSHLRAWRLKEEISQSQAAERLGCSQPTISSWESGRLLPDASNLKKIGSVIGVSVDALLADAEDTEVPPVSLPARAG